jgi:23S rRNA (adenine2503-C2)-methyltransferase
VTTQVGCRIGCTFCASTLGGLKRNLGTGEIVAQVLEAQKFLDASGERVRSVVVMGSGEPFENYDATIRFIRIINDAKGLNIGQRHITVSTSGVVPNIYRFADEDWQVGLAISLHAPNQELRSSLMPINRRFPLAELLDACWYYLKKTGRRLTFEYALIGGKNDRSEHAHELGKLLQGMNCLVNLIPVNYVPERNFQRTPRNQIFEFKRILESYRVNVTIRREHGHDIDAACGQLRAKHSKLI